MQQLELLSSSSQRSSVSQSSPENQEAIDVIHRNQYTETRIGGTGQLDLFRSPYQQPPEPRPSPKNEEAVKAIRGLQYIEDYISVTDHYWFLGRIDKQQWLNDLKRRVQHYGFKYDYRARRVDLGMHIGELPQWLGVLVYRLEKEGYMPGGTDQVIVNEYQPGQGISSHIDCEPCFKETIVSLSLGSGCIMDFTNKFEKKRKISVWLAPRSLVVLSGEARHEWLHGIAARKWDEWEGQKHKRQRRVSLTFRKVIL